MYTVKNVRWSQTARDYIILDYMYMPSLLPVIDIGRLDLELSFPKLSMFDSIECGRKHNIVFHSFLPPPSPGFITGMAMGLLAESAICLFVIYRTKWDKELEKAALNTTTRHDERITEKTGKYQSMARNGRIQDPGEEGPAQSRRFTINTPKMFHTSYSGRINIPKMPFLGQFHDQFQSVFRNKKARVPDDVSQILCMVLMNRVSKNAQPYNTSAPHHSNKMKNGHQNLSIQTEGTFSCFCEAKSVIKTVERQLRRY
jgi:hypothetical protein